MTGKGFRAFIRENGKEFDLVAYNEHGQVSCVQLSRKEFINLHCSTSSFIRTAWQMKE